MRNVQASAAPLSFADADDLGVEWAIDARGCDPAALRDASLVLAFVSDLVQRMVLHPLGAPLVHKFAGEGGVTALVLLSESHIAIHTFPEVNVATVSVYSCRPRPTVDWGAALARFFRAESTRVQRLARGGRGSP